MDGTDFLTIEGLAPDVEELAERVGPVDRRLGVDDSVGGMRVQPHEARGSGDKRTARSRLHLKGRPDADRCRHLSRNTPDEDRQVRVDVKEHLLACLACDAVDLLAGRRQARRSQRAGFGDRHAFGPQRPDRCGRAEVSHAGERCERERRGTGASVSS